MMYRVLWRDWHNLPHNGFFYTFEDAMSYAGDVLDSYTESMIMSIEAYSIDGMEPLHNNILSKHMKEEDEE